MEGYRTQETLGFMIYDPFDLAQDRFTICDWLRLRKAASTLRTDIEHFFMLSFLCGPFFCSKLSKKCIKTLKSVSNIEEYAKKSCPERRRMEPILAKSLGSIGVHSWFI